MINYSQPRECHNSLHPLLHNRVLPEKSLYSEVAIQLLLFVDHRPSSEEHIQRIRQSLDVLGQGCQFELEIINVGEHPYLAEHYKLIATPTLIKVYPEPKQTLAGSDLVAQLEYWWSYWKHSLHQYWLKSKAEEHLAEAATPLVSNPSVASVTQFIQLSDEIFRLKQEKELLQEQLRFKDRVIDMLAHDLRNPVTAASLALETLEISKNTQDSNSAYLSPAFLASLVKQARRQIKTIDRMITDLLQGARGTNAALQIYPEKLKIGEFCQDILTNLKPQFQAKSLHLQTDIPNDLPLVYADPERLRQVVMNLLDNAIKYTPEGGNIHVSILHRTTQKIQVSICDSGPGIPEENRERIFEDNFRLERDECKDGYGIGLSLCQRVIRAHYGEVWVDASLNTGSCFHFTLPVYR